MNRIVASAALAAALAASALPALAKEFVQDNAGMFGAGTVSQLNARISNFNRDTGKEIVVVTAPSVPGGDARTAAENTYAQQSVNGVLIFVDKGDRRSQVIPDRAAVQAGWWNSQTSASVLQAMNSQFHAGNFDAGITAAVNSVFDVYRSHVSSIRSNAPASSPNYAQQTQSGGVHIGVFWWIIIALFAFFIIRALMRARSGAYYGGGYGGPGSGPAGPGPGYGPGYGGGWGGGWGGGLWSGLLGGLGGAWLGNELFGHQNYGGMQGGMVDPGMQAPPDAGGWQSDPGQADMGGSAGGDWGGGFGGGDFGGGFGGGDAGGGW